jgi:hypothetical protein
LGEAKEVDGKIHWARHMVVFTVPGSKQETPPSWWFFFIYEVTL